MSERVPETKPAAVRDPAAALALVDEPAWVIDWVAAEIVAANPAGAERLAASTERRRAGLDAAMPGFARLRQLASSGRLGEGVREHLILWTARGAEALRCRIEPLAGDRSGRLLVVKVEAPALAVAGEAADGGGVAQPRSDFETLQAIARQIREGKRGPQAEAVSDVIAADEAEALARTVADADGAAHPARGQARLAHELKTPLSAIAVAAELMREERFGSIGNERYRTYAADIHENARHALELVQRMLGDAAGTGGDAAALPEQSFTEIDLNAIVTASAQGLGLLAERAGVTFDCVTAARLPRVIADETSVRQMLINLATNALKFTPLGGRVLVETVHRADGRVEMAVVDTGTGISAQALNAVLAGDGGGDLVPRPGGGLGIGLPLVKRLAAANGAALAIDSAPGKGTRAAIVFNVDRVLPV